LRFLPRIGYYQRMMKARGLLIFLFLASLGLIQAQEIMTAEKYLAAVGERYAQIKDYEAKIVIATAKAELFGVVMHRNPGLLRIDFTKPEGQTIVYNGEVLTVYLPEYRAVLSQTVDGDGKSSAASLASAQGLVLLQRNYAPAFKTGPDPVVLEEGSAELVVFIALTRRSLSEGFRTLTLAISPDTLLIRRIVGETIADESVRFDFSDIKLDQGIPEARFLYDSPASANLYNNFLFKDAN